MLFFNRRLSSLMVASLILTACASSTGQFYERTGLIEYPKPLAIACPPAEPLTDGRASMCYLRTVTEALKYADCRTSYKELEDRHRILIETITDQPRHKRTWKFWQRGN